MADHACSLFPDEATCDTTRCKWNTNANVCWPKGNLAVPCDMFQAEKAADCPARCDAITDDTGSIMCQTKGYVPPCPEVYEEAQCTGDCKWNPDGMYCYDSTLPPDCHFVADAECTEANGCKKVGGECLFTEEPVNCINFAYTDAEGCSKTYGCAPDCDEQVCNKCTGDACDVPACAGDVQCDTITDQTECASHSQVCLWDDSQSACLFYDPLVICDMKTDETECAASTEPKCYWYSNGDFCESEPPPTPTVDTGKKCGTYNEESCPFPRCALRYEDAGANGTCSDAACNDLYGTYCEQLAGCVLVGEDYCFKKGEPVPCYAFNDETDCKTAMTCTWNDDSYCETFDTGKKCPTYTQDYACPEQRCEWNYDNDGCEDLPCFAYSNQTRCEAAGCEYNGEFNSCSVPDDGAECPTHTSDDACPVGRCEWEYSNEGVGGTCNNIPCSSLYSEGSCQQSPSGCSWDGYCFKDSGAQCSTYAADLECPPNRCVWDGGEDKCRRKGCVDYYEKGTCEDEHPQGLVCEWDAITDDFGDCREGTVPNPYQGVCF